MSISSLVARPLLAGMFVYGGLDAFRNPGGKVPRAEKVAPDIAEAVGIDADTEQLVQFNGAVQVVAENCVQRNKKGIVLAALSKLSPVQPAMAAEGCVKAKG